MLPLRHREPFPFPRLCSGSRTLTTRDSLRLPGVVFNLDVMGVMRRLLARGSLLLLLLLMLFCPTLVACEGPAGQIDPRWTPAWTSPQPPQAWIPRPPQSTLYLSQGDCILPLRPFRRYPPQQRQWFRLS
jgi:hypothetical protein